MTENEAKEVVKKLRNKAELFKNSGFAVDGIVKSFEDSANAIETLSEEIQQYRAIGLTPELIEAMQGHNIAMINDLGEYQAIGTVEELKHLKKYVDVINKLCSDYSAIGTVEEVRMLKDYKELYDAYLLIGTIEEFRNLKYKKNVLPIATIEFSKEDMQKMVGEKVAQIELNIQGIRAEAIDEFAHQLKENLNQEFPSNYESTRPYFSLENARLSVDEIAEQMKRGGVE